MPTSNLLTPDRIRQSCSAPCAAFLKQLLHLAETLFKGSLKYCLMRSRVMTIDTIEQMAFGEIAKQLAQHALADQAARTPSGPALSDSVGAIMVGQIQAMQKACEEDEELVVLFRSGAETVRVLEFIVPSWQVLVLAGIDEAKNTTRVVSTPERAELVCKVMKVRPPGKPARVGFRGQKPKPE